MQGNKLTSENNKIVNVVDKLASTGFLHIFGSSTVNKIVATLSNIVLVRVMSKDDYGVYSYVYNIVSIFILFNGLGATSAILQLCSEAFDEKRKRLAFSSYGKRSGVKFDIILALIMIASALFLPMGFAGSNVLLMEYSLYPLVILLFELHQTDLRVVLNNKEYAYMTTIQTASMAIGSIVGAVVAQAPGLIAGQYFSYAISWIAGVKRSSDFKNRERVNLAYAEKRVYWKIALVSAINNGLGQALTLVGTFAVGVFLQKESLVADYKVATTIPFALLFIPSSLVVYIYPYFVRHKNDKVWTVKRYRQLIFGSSLVMGTISLLCVIFSETIIVLIFGESYIDSAKVFRVMMLGFFITASFRQPTGNLLVTQRKLSFNFWLGIFSLIVCIGLNWLLIIPFGLMGAAWAYVGVMAFGSVCNMTYYITVIRRIEG